MTWVNSYTNPSFKFSWRVLLCRPSCKTERCFSGAVIEQVYGWMPTDLMSSSKRSFWRGLKLSWQCLCSWHNSLFTIYLCCSVACGIPGMSVACLPHRCRTQGSKKLSMSEILQGVCSTGIHASKYKPAYSSLKTHVKAIPMTNSMASSLKPLLYAWKNEGKPSWVKASFIEGYLGKLSL